MKTLTITYDTYIIENEQKVYGETCMDIAMNGDVADRLIDHGSSGIAVARIEKILQNAELLKGRHYIKGSIKDFERKKNFATRPGCYESRKDFENEK